MHLPHHSSKNGPKAIIAGFSGALGLFALALSFLGSLPFDMRFLGVFVGLCFLAASVHINLRAKDGE